MSEPSDNPIVRNWGEYEHRPRRWLRSPARRVKLVVGLLLVAAAAGAIWFAVRPQPWRPGFARCNYGGELSAWCSTIAVPADPRHPKGPTIDLHVAVVPATTHPAAGALFYLEGGPGGAATQAAIEVNQLFAEVGRDRDLVMVDQRGMGLSTPLVCPDRRVRADDAGALAGYLDSCFAHLRGDPRLDSTAAAAADVEAIRRKLGYGRIDLYGASYGATLAQAYLDRYPSSVRTVVLDSGSLPNVRIYDRSAANAQHALDGLLARCAKSAPCHRYYPRTSEELAALLRRRPVRVTVPQGAFVLRPDDVAWTVNALAQTVSGAATIPYVVHAASRGNYVPLAQAFGEDVGRDLDARSRQAAVWVILCSEPWARSSAAATEGGSYLAAAARARARLFAHVCSVVPRELALPARVATVAHAPVLLLAGGDDPLDPVANLAGWRRVYPDGRLVVVPDAAHGTLGFSCVQRLVAEFVARDGSGDVDAGCARRITPAPFETG